MNNGLAGLRHSGARTTGRDLGPGLVLDIEAGRVANVVAFDALQVDVPLVAGIAAGPQDDLHSLHPTRQRPGGMEYQARAEQQVHHHCQRLQVEHVVQPLGHPPPSDLASALAVVRGLDCPEAFEQRWRVLVQQVLHGGQNRVGRAGDVGGSGPRRPSLFRQRVKPLGCRVRRKKRYQGYDAAVSVALCRPHGGDQAHPFPPGLLRHRSLGLRAAGDPHDGIGIRRPGRGAVGIGRGPLEGQVADAVLDPDDCAGVVHGALDGQALVRSGHVDPVHHVRGRLQVGPRRLGESARRERQAVRVCFRLVPAMAPGEILQPAKGILDRRARSSRGCRR